MTGAYLRGPGYTELRREVERARRSETPLTVAFVDVNGLKAINDSKGHEEGDHALFAVAQALRASLRSYDLLIRYGGDEFLAVMAGQTIPSASARIDLSMERLARSEPPRSISVGLAEFRPGDSVATLVARADLALYRDRLLRPGAD